MVEFIEEIPSFGQFRADLMPINPDGDLEKAYTALKIELGSDKKTTKGDPLTWSYIREKYAAHVAKWSEVFGKRDKQYIATKDLHELKTIQDFLEKSLYNREYVIQKGTASRNSYLFGSLPTYNLMHQLNEFKRSLQTKD
jgi:hypothetical protein